MSFLTLLTILALFAAAAALLFGLTSMVRDGEPDVLSIDAHLVRNERQSHERYEGVT